jgi:SAM-dependent methyltransferase
MASSAPEPTTGDAPIGCAHAGASPVLEAADYVTGHRFEVRVCPDCGLAVTWPPLSDDGMAPYYPPGYYGSGQRYPWPLESLLSGVLARRARRLEQWLGRRGRVLDVGCGPGHLLHSFQRRGWTTVGLERSDTAARTAREVYGLDVRVGTLRDAGFPPRSFDAVVLWHVLEHLADPEATIADAGGLLTPGGVLLVGVPDFGSIEARWAGSSWFHLDVPRHRTHMTAATLEAMLRRCGFAVLSAHRSAPEYDVFSALQSALNRLGLRPNALFTWLRRRDARAASSQTRHEAVSVALAALLAPLALLWTSLAAARDAGATITVYCRPMPAARPRQ